MKAILVTLFVGLFACAIASPGIAAEVPKNKATVTIIHSFGSGADGSGPVAALLDVKGKLYGTTQYGGACPLDGGCGTLFELDPRSGAEKVLYSFCTQANCTDGEQPLTNLTEANGTLYGTTIYGGANESWGTIFAFDLQTGVETVLYSFCSQQGCADGRNPNPGVIMMNNTLFGTTSGGGYQSQGGVAFALDPDTGAETVLYTFCGAPYCADGSQPLAGLIAEKGILYGTTSQGATGDCAESCGTVFSLDPATGAETVLHYFGGNDGQKPAAGLIEANGTLYGTTMLGGTDRNGTVFALDPNSGAESVLYSFDCKRRRRCLEGTQPTAPLIAVKGTLYGTVAEGGTGKCRAQYVAGCGAVFAIDPAAGAETIVHSFLSHDSDGAYPDAGLINVKGTLYGTTSKGGKYGYGTVFSLKP